MQQRKLGEIATFIDYRGKTPRKSQSGIPLITAKIVKNGTILPANEFISVEDYDGWMTRGLPKFGDVVLTTEAPLGEVAQLKDEHVALAQRIITLRGKTGLLDNSYLKYYLQSEEGQKRLKARETGTTVTGIKSAELQEVLIPLPPLTTQKQIAQALLCLDDKIELNTRINQNLEAQLFALFAYHYENAPIEQVPLKDFCSFQEGYVNPSQTHSTYFDGPIKWLRAVDINESYIISTSRTLSEEGFLSAGKSALFFPPDSIAISKSGTIGRIGIVANKMCGNRAVIDIVPAKKEWLGFIYCYLKSRQKEFPDLAVGSVQKNLYISVLEQLNVKTPATAFWNGFHDCAQAIMNEMKNNCFMSEQLTLLRNVLLPKLMHGEFDMSTI